MSMGFLGMGGAALLAWLNAPGLAFGWAGASIGLLFPSYFVEASRVLGGSERTAAIAMVAVFIGAVTVPAGFTLVLGWLGMTAFFPTVAGYAALATAATLHARARARRPT
jgi:hypothetical protein